MLPFRLVLGLCIPSTRKNILLQDFVNLKLTHFSICYTVWFSPSEVVLLSNASTYRKMWKTRLTMFIRMVGEKVYPGKTKDL